jgi:hypothetical protein
LPVEKLVLFLDLLSDKSLFTAVIPPIDIEVIVKLLTCEVFSVLLLRFSMVLAAPVSFTMFFSIFGPRWLLFFYTFLSLNIVFASISL